ncbi:Synaptotagmin-9 [Seminavis robusta]|uniref:Synaptotagmin-9 n=1 Tax=Seminavis robusta TaxID=568900 RepID=A0A9N8D9V2_9STRA|nr:Synaptotagmin-9 [Seminavis robusta]|eukprot:Sro10_g008220.1 Synaptotagmin-9 (133) ;mRNA; r:167590-168270
MGVLTIFLDKAENLGNADFFSASDPYVLLELEQDNWVKDVDYGVQKSSSKNDDLNPVYGETFTFNIPTLDNMVLTCKIKDDDTGSSHEKLGWCKFNLEKLGLSETPMAVDKVVDRNVFTQSAKIYLKLSYKE